MNKDLRGLFVGIDELKSDFGMTFMHDKQAKSFVRKFDSYISLFEIFMKQFASLAHDIRQVMKDLFEFSERIEVLPEAD